MSLDACGVGARGAVTAAQPTCVWWPRDAEATLDSPEL